MTTQTQAAKQVTKPAAKRASKPAAKPAAKPASGAAYVLLNRPSAGNALKAFTQAVQELYGMDKGKGAAKSALVKVAGATAVRYHLGKGTYAEQAGQVTITAPGRAFFGSRAGQIDRELVDAYKQVMTTGKPNDKVCKNADLIKAA